MHLGPIALRAVAIGVCGLQWRIRVAGYNVVSVYGFTILKRFHTDSAMGGTTHYLFASHAVVVVV